MINQSSQKGALQVTADPQSTVYLNNKIIGKTPLCKCDAGNLLPVGDYTIRLVPKDQSLGEFQEQITITEAVLTVVDRKFANDSLSEGSVISLSPLADANKTALLVVSIPQGAEVSLDNNNIGQTPLLYNNPTASDHVIEVTKDGYNEKTIKINTPMGYKLTLQAYLSTNPDEAFENAGASPTPILSGTPAPSSSQIATILNTPTGFLRVRENPSAGSAEIGEVYPGETHPVVGSQSGWLEIQLNNGTVGWISNEYAQVQQ